MNSQIWWFVARSSGIVAWALLTLSVCWGLFVSTRAVAKLSTAAWLLDLHRFLSGLSVAFVAVHLVGLWADDFVVFGWTELFVPMASTWKPGPVAFGIVAMYLLVAVHVSSLAMKHLPRRWWRMVHRLGLPLYAIATYHGLASGTDRSATAFRLASVASINIVAFLAILLVLASRKASLDKIGQNEGPVEVRERVSTGV
jgi:predicted ferric reductase